MPLNVLPKHRPYRAAGAMFQIGLKPMDMPTWLDTGDDHAAFMAAKRQRLAGRPPVYYRSLPRSITAQSELLGMVAAQLAKHHRGSFEVKVGQIHDLLDGSLHPLAQQDHEPLEIAANVLEEDFILFEKQEGSDIITAASNAYTSSGRIVSCVGRDMHYAHDPVPGLNAQLAARIDRVLANVQVGAPVVRFNWFVTAIANRLYPEGSHHANAAASEEVAQALSADHSRAGELLHVRTERQTFVRLPETKALAFGIHTYSNPLSSLDGDDESLAAMHKLIGEYSEDRLRYSGLHAIKAPLQRWIEDRLT
jgi:hypothetical protein